MRSFLTAFLIFYLLGNIVLSQTHKQDDYVLFSKKTTDKIILDGIADESTWQNAIEIGDFWLKFPTADRKSTTKTTVKSAYDDKFVYFLIEAFDSTNRYIAPSLKRDNSIALADGVAILLDPVNKKSNGFGFACTPNNVQSEYLFSPNSERPEFAWDNKWFSSTKKLADRYVIEMAIPFKTLRFDADNTRWGLNFIRADQKKNEFSTWTNVPVQFQGFDIGYLGTLQFERELQEQKGNISIIPYISTRSVSDVENGEPTSYKTSAGFDAKVAVSPSLNLDLTVNPDFSQVDVDQQVTNLTRFSIFFPERRTFFLENSDIFSEYGAPPFRPFFSRSIGLDKNAQPIPILFGARLSGNLTQKMRIGVMNMQTQRKGDFAAQNYTVASLNQRVGARSVVKGYFMNRDASTKEGEAPLSSLEKFGRNAGGEFNFTSKTGEWQGWAGYHTSFKEGLDKDRSFYQVGFGHFGNVYSGIIDFDNFGKNYYADMGFINRLETYAQTGPTYDFADTTFRSGFKQMYNQNNFTFRPKDRKVIQMVFGISNYAVWFTDGKLSDRTHSLSSVFTFLNTAGINLKYNIQEDNLRYFFPLPDEKPLSPGNYNYQNFTAQFTGDTRKNAILDAGFTTGGFFNGKITQYTTALTLRKQPWVNMVLNAQYNDLKFSSDYGRTKLWLIGPKVEATFSNKLFWTSFLQFNTQQNNFNINSRIQYRYSPMSDFFLVYSDNYFSDPFLKNKNRALIFKLNYWLTM